MISLNLVGLSKLIMKMIRAYMVAISLAIIYRGLVMGQNSRSIIRFSQTNDQICIELAKSNQEVIKKKFLIIDIEQKLANFRPRARNVRKSSNHTHFDST